MAAVVGFDMWKRPYVRVICRLLDMEYRQDWSGIQKLARENAMMSNRPMACSYAIALVQTGQIAERLYDIRLDYDSLHVHGMDWKHNNASVPMRASFMFQKAIIMAASSSRHNMLAWNRW